jgi:inorganic phosphate transporter, PiT family
MIWFFLLSGLFLGWSLGANDAANVFGTAVGTRMVRFKVAAAIASVFVILGAVISGSGTSETLAALGAVNAMAGSFTVALAAGATVAWMNRTRVPVSTTQAIVGAIVGWNLFTHSHTNYAVLSQIIATWILSPLLAAVFAIILFFIFRRTLGRARIHMLRVDAYTRAGLIIVGALGSYSLGANNIANVMGVFVPASPFHDITLFGTLKVMGTQQLFLLGALAIAAGICTHSQRLMNTVGSDIFKLTPILALIVVLAHTLVLMAFSSKGLQHVLLSLGLPALPLVPVSSTQAIIGAIIGVGIIKGGRGINFKILGRIAAGWVITPVFAALLTFGALFFVQNVFEQEVIHRPAAQQQTIPIVLPAADAAPADSLIFPDSTTAKPLPTN